VNPDPTDEPERAARPGSSPAIRWGLGDVAAGLGLGLVASAVGAVVLFGLRGYDDTADITLVDQSILQMCLWVGPLGVPLWAARFKGDGPVSDYGLRVRWWPDAPVGLSSGLATQLLALPLIYVVVFAIFGDQDVSAPARELTDKAGDSLPGAVLLFVVVAICTPVVEEMFFRGLLLRSIERRWGTQWAVWGSSLVFGLFHFQLIQFPALVVFGLVAAFLTVRTQRLGPAIFAHVAFNAVTVTLLLCDCVG
jgi:membrane protease YdiL (CAAX protease family)